MVTIENPNTGPCRHCKCDIEGHVLFAGKMFIHTCDHDHGHPPEPDNRIGAKEI